MGNYEVIYDRAGAQAWEGCPNFDNRANQIRIYDGLISRIVAFSNKIRFTYWYEKRHDVKVVLE
jgi:hypothetical protein